MISITLWKKRTSESEVFRHCFVASVTNGFKVSKINFFFVSGTSKQNAMQQPLEELSEE